MMETIEAIRIEMERAHRQAERNVAEAAKGPLAMDQQDMFGGVA